MVMISEGPKVLPIFFCLTVLLPSRDVGGLALAISSSNIMLVHLFINGRTATIHARLLIQLVSTIKWVVCFGLVTCYIFNQEHIFLDMYII